MLVSGEGSGEPGNSPLDSGKKFQNLWPLHLHVNQYYDYDDDDPYYID